MLGKPIAGGVPASVWGMSDEVATRYADYNRTKEPGYSGMGTTLSANPLQFAAMRATLEEVMTEENYARMDRLALRLDAGLTGVIDRYRLPWHVARVGARVEFICAPGPLRNGGEAEAAHAPELEAAIHVALVNRGVLIAPFHNMMLISPATTGAQVNRLITAFAAVAARLDGMRQARGMRQHASQLESIMTSPSGSTPAEAQAFLDAHPEIEAFDIVLTDANGVGRGKIVRRHELISIFEGGRHMPISILGLDITGEDVHETGLIWTTGDGDLRAWPIPGTLVPLYGTQPAARPGADGDVPSRRPADVVGPAAGAGQAGRHTGGQGPLSRRRLRARILPARQ